jgi:hypothetical protein
MSLATKQISYEVEVQNVCNLILNSIVKAMAKESPLEIAATELTDAVKALSGLNQAVADFKDVNIDITMALFAVNLKRAFLKQPLI